MEELTQNQQEELRKNLEALVTELENVLRISSDNAKPVELDQPIGRVSRMDALQQQSMAKANRRAAELRLQQVRAALNRISRDNYGFCLECEEGVGFGRLKVRPEAALCINCQSQREKR